MGGEGGRAYSQRRGPPSCPHLTEHRGTSWVLTATGRPDRGGAWCTDYALSLLLERVCTVPGVLCSSPGAWVITGGSHTGVMKQGWRGSAAAEWQLLRKGKWSPSGSPRGTLHNREPDPPHGELEAALGVGAQEGGGRI